MAPKWAAAPPALGEDPETECLDFRAPLDDAWYAVRLRVEQGALRVMYCNFSDDYDELYRADGFRTAEELEEFRGRFRPTTIQLQDDECRKVIEGMEVCASYAFGDNDIRFYDAVIDAEIRIPDSSNVLEQTSRGKSCIKSNSKLDEDLSQINIFHEESYHLFHIENLDKDLSSVTIMDFIHEQTSIYCQAAVFPCYWSTSYHTGTIFVKSKEHADKLLKFLCDPSHIIVSSSGRPWVTSEKWCGVNKGVMPKFEGQLKLKEKQSRELKLVHRRTKEYDKAKKLQSLHLDFHDHVQNLHRRLTWEERKIMMHGDCK
ncbi:uncharacterized protein LOC120111150 isoform X2 [Phoenix dactylifera]|uniref:Uncharacterized protein LOC120111150 isoform X2 n=1 Tax=Phoenix dactylifera TaxID=42345 RepID=A0A8B9AD14_PHODC|nr:uncharacterized protein LOC120111150 isoform X2 [Phoenix dactylifera]